MRHPVRRAVLAVVLDADGPVAIDALVRAVDDRGREFGVDRFDAGDGDCDGSLRVALVHRHLPILVMADLLSRRDDAVAPGDNRLLSHPSVDASSLGRGGADWEALGAVFGQPRRCEILTVLATATFPVGLSPLARSVAAERVGDISPEAPVLEDFEARFHHVDLPILDEADVVTYDVRDRLVRDVSKPDLPFPVHGF